MDRKAGLQQSKKAWLLNRWVDEWMGGIKLNYNGGPFSKSRETAMSRNVAVRDGLTAIKYT